MSKQRPARQPGAAAEGPWPSGGAPALPLTALSALTGLAAPDSRATCCSGRKKAALLYVVTYTLSCFTKHSPDYWVLMVGRVLGGIATSLLFSAFESWVVGEHFARGFDERWLGDTFSKVGL